jgi:phage terminase large subunit
VHRTLREQIERLALQSQYEVQQSIIRHRTTGTEFVFTGLQNPDALKSLEGATVAWIEEAQSVSDESWRKLIPTVRRPNSEIWLTWNPELESDPTWKRFVLKPPPGMVEIIMNFSDNPWASEVLRDEREQMEAEDPEEYAHVWLGQPRRQTKGSIYGNELRLAEEQGRILDVPYAQGIPVDCGFDLGDGDFTAIWFVQRVMGQYRAIDYEEDRHKPLSHYLSLLEGKGYKYGRIFFPWDAASKIVVGSLEASMRSRGFNVTVLPRQSREAGIDAVREGLGTTWFDAAKCELGIQRLRHYRYGETALVDQISGGKVPTRDPIHDDNSHGADALRTFAMGIKLPVPVSMPQPQQKRTPPPKYQGRPSSWS